MGGRFTVDVRYPQGLERRDGWLVTGYDAKTTASRLHVGVIGAGRVGTALGVALERAGHRVVAVSAVSAASRRRAARSFPGACLLPADEVAAVSDLVLLAVPDDTLARLVDGLAGAGAWRHGHIVVHTSGAHGVAVLAPAERAGVLPLALHPAMTFTGRAEDTDRLVGVTFGVTAAEEYRPVAEALVLEMGGEPAWIPEQLRGIYHAGLSMGANHLTTLVGEAADMLRAAGVADPTAVLRPLLTAALDNALSHGDSALTGPVARGDAGTVRRHLAELVEHTPASVPAYLAMARRTAVRAVAAGVVRAVDAAPVFDVLAPEHSARGEDR